MRSHLVVFATCIAMSAFPALAQTGGGTGTGTGTGTISGVATCTTPPQAPTALLLERAINPTTTAFTNVPANYPVTTPTISTYQTNLPTAITGLLPSTGTYEARTQFQLSTNAAGGQFPNGTIQVTSFVVPTGSPSPTPNLGTLPFGTIFNSFTINVSQVITSCSPVPSVTYVGTIGSNSPNTVYGALSGATAILSLGYSTATPTTVNNVVLLIPGVFVQSSAAASGTLTVPAGSVTPPGSTNNAPVVVFSPGATQTTATRQIQLNACGSTDPNNLQLSYVWTVPTASNGTSYPLVAISNGNTCSPLITFGEGKNVYTIQVTVTNSKGVSTPATTTITYTGQ